MNEPYAVTFAKAHLDSFLTDYVIVGFNRKDPELKIQHINQTTSPELLAKLYQLLIQSIQPPQKHD